jgi:hypothetical protein
MVATKRRFVIASSGERLAAKKNRFAMMNLRLASPFFADHSPAPNSSVEPRALEAVEPSRGLAGFRCLGLSRFGTDIADKSGTHHSYCAHSQLPRRLSRSMSAESMQKYTYRLVVRR